jgi:dienelactone hydrolase
MAEVLLFHHAHGLTSGVLDFAERLRRGGHTVHTPDLFDGRVFDTLDEGTRYAEQVGISSIVERGVQVAEPMRRRLVYMGLSLGVLPAQKLAQTRGGATGAVFVSACAPVSEFGRQWPDGVPVQIHGMAADAVFVGKGDLDAAQTLVSSAGAALFLYSGKHHIFTDNQLPSYVADAAALLTERVLALLDDIA